MCKIRKHVTIEIYIFLQATLTDTAFHHLSNLITEHDLAPYYAIIYHLRAIHLTKEQTRTNGVRNRKYPTAIIL